MSVLSMSTLKTSITLKRSNMSGISERTFLRGVALQALYEYNQSHHKVADILTYRFEEVDIPDDDEKKFVIDLVTGVINHKAEIDEMIQKYAKEWPIEQIAIIDVNIIRIAVYL